MKTTSYNPSELEVKIAEAITDFSDELEGKLDGINITKIENKIVADNPLVRIHVLDQDGDPHEIVLKIIQKPDTF